jgi:hypothetical protein
MIHRGVSVKPELHVPAVLPPEDEKLSIEKSGPRAG